MAMIARAEGELRILYVEDNELIREMTSELLSRPGRRVVSVASAEEAIAESERNGLDVLITDVSLPRMSGLDLARRLAHQRPRLPIIVITGYEWPGVLDGWDANAAVLCKPVLSEQVEPLIEKLLQAAAG